MLMGLGLKLNSFGTQNRKFVILIYNTALRSSNMAGLLMSQ